VEGFVTAWKLSGLVELLTLPPCLEVVVVGRRVVVVVVFGGAT